MVTLKQFILGHKLELPCRAWCTIYYRKGLLIVWVGVILNKSVIDSDWVVTVKMTTAQVVKTSIAVDKSLFRPTLTQNWHRIVRLDFCLVDSRSHKGRRSNLCKREDICCRRGLASRITIGLFAAVRAVHAVITVYCGANSATVSQAKQEVTPSYINTFDTF